ncbi:MAG: hypothetical protein ABS76_18720 [Pelagibacterium sp. SCN 64-44]|nr:MAG: hypothetical protein ABS76_18720 [Pelagibacterium sp. SCN 64-44]
MFSGLFFAALASFGLALPVLADGTGEHSIDTSKLVFHHGRPYAVSYDETVSSDPVSVSRIKKIEAGRVSWVTIATTASGTYSTDAMFSPHMQYPGVSVERLGWPYWAYHAPSPRTRFSYWSGTNWTSMSLRSGNSFYYYSESKR